jgi:hypothetical protein
MSDDDRWAGIGCLIVLAAIFVAGVIAIIAISVLSPLAIGSAIGLPTGVFHGFRNYLKSIGDSISNQPLKITMIAITISFAFAFLVTIGYLVTGW